MAENEISKMTLQELISNPTGKRSAYMASRKMIKDGLAAKYDYLIFKHKKFSYKIYKQGEDYIFHYKIPSETYDNFYYDVIIQFYPDPEDYDNCINDKTTNKYLVKVFSNSPAFMFTYTYVVFHNNMLVDGMNKFCSKTALTSPPTIKNPVETYGYEKTVYMACLDIINKKLYKKFDIDKMLYKMKNDTFDNTIESQEFKLAQYNKQKDNKKKEKRKQQRNIVQVLDVLTKNKNVAKARKEIKKILSGKPTSGRKKRPTRRPKR